MSRVSAWVLFLLATAGAWMPYLVFDGGIVLGAVGWAGMLFSGAVLEKFAR